MALEIGKIEKLYIQACKDSLFKEKCGQPFYALINPESYSFKYKVDYCETQAAGTSGVALKFNKIQPQDLSFDFLFDGTGVVKPASVVNLAVANPLAEKKDVAQQIEDFKHYLLEYNGKIHRPNYLRIHWGTLLFKGVLTAMDIEFKLFNPDGSPLRAIAKCTFKGSIEENLQNAKNNPSSPDTTHERTFRSGDRLTLMSGDIYNDQQYYIDVASANRLDGFRKIKPGTKVIFPPLKD